MSRKVTFSNNWKKAKTKVTKCHQKIGNIRRDYLHKTTTAISQNHAMVCIEDLQVRHMSKSSAGSAEAPGRNVKAKSGLNQSILDQGWFEFRRQTIARRKPALPASSVDLSKTPIWSVRSIF